MAKIDIHRTENPGWLSNAYLLVNPDTQQGVLIDGNDVPGPLLERIENDGIEITAILLTHHHADHVVIDAYRTLGAPVYAHPDTASLANIDVDHTLADGEELQTAGMTIEALYTPGHASDHIAFLVDGADCFTSDVLFKGTVGGTRGPGGSDLTDLRKSIDRIVALGPDTVLHPGHREPTTVAVEQDENPFLRAWQAGEEPLSEQVTVRGEPATLLLWGPDYDGTNKAWIRGADGVDHVIGGSQVTRD
jgi:hydroxyacylglutathione hydrolase